MWFCHHRHCLSAFLCTIWHPFLYVFPLILPWIDAIKYRCTHCSEDFGDKVKATEHSSAMECLSQQFQCKTCTMEFRNAFLLQKHKCNGKPKYENCFNLKDKLCNLSQHDQSIIISIVRAIFKWMSKMIRSAFFFLLYSTLWLVEKSFCLSLNQSDVKLNQLRLGRPRFPALCFPAFCRFYFEWIEWIFLSSDWPLWLLWFWFYGTQS